MTEWWQLSLVLSSAFSGVVAWLKIKNCLATGTGSIYDDLGEIDAELNNVSYGSVFIVY